MTSLNQQPQSFEAFRTCFYLTHKLKLDQINNQQIVDLTICLDNQCVILLGHQCIIIDLNLSLLKLGDKDSAIPKTTIKLKQKGIAVYPIKLGICIVTTENYNFVQFNQRQRDKLDYTQSVVKREINSEVMFFHQSQELYQIFLNSNGRVIRKIRDHSLIYQTPRSNCFDQIDDTESITVHRSNNSLTIYNLATKIAQRYDLSIKRTIFGISLINKYEGLALVKANSYLSLIPIKLSQTEISQQPDSKTAFKHFKLSVYAWIMCLNRQFNQIVINDNDTILMYDYKNKYIVRKLRNKGLGIPLKNMNLNFNRILELRNADKSKSRREYGMVEVNVVYYKGVSLKRILMHLYQKGGLEQRFGKGQMMIRLMRLMM